MPATVRKSMPKGAREPSSRGLASRRPDSQGGVVPALGSVGNAGVPPPKSSRRGGDPRRSGGGRAGEIVRPLPSPHSAGATERVPSGRTSAPKRSLRGDRPPLGGPESETGSGPHPPRTAEGRSSDRGTSAAPRSRPTWPALRSLRSTPGVDPGIRGWDRSRVRRWSFRPRRTRGRGVSLAIGAGPRPERRTSLRTLASPPPWVSPAPSVPFQNMSSRTSFSGGSSSDRVASTISADRTMSALRSPGAGDRAPPRR